MIDLHNHLLPEIDDGPDTWEETLQMCRMAVQDGITHIAATPHISPESRISSKVIEEKVQQLNDRLDEAGLDLDVTPAADVYLDPGIFSLLESDKLLTIGEKKRYLLLEIPSVIFPRYLGRFIFELQTRGLTPIITHPERNIAIQQDPFLLREIVQQGALIQVTAMSMTNGFGSRSRKCIKQLLRADMVHLIASDAHSIDHRPPLLSSAVEAAARIVGLAQAESLVNSNPQAIMNGESLM